MSSEAFFFIFGEVIEDASFRDVLHDLCHFIDRPLPFTEVEAASVELPTFFVVQVRAIELAEHRDRRDPIKD